MNLQQQIQQAQNRMLEISDEIDAIGQVAVDESRNMNDDDANTVSNLNTEFDALEKNVERLGKAQALKEKAAAAKLLTRELATPGDAAVPGEARQNLVPARARMVRTKHFESNFDAYASGQFIAAMCGNGRSRQWCRDQGMKFFNDMEEGTDTLGGFSVPQPLESTIIRLVEQYGVYRRYARTAIMTSNTLDVPKLADGGNLTVTYPGEGGAITASDLTFAQVNLVATKYACHAVWSTELNEDSVINMSDLLAEDIGWNFALSEDTNSFLGDGSAPFGGITGVQSALQAGATVTAGATVGAITLADYEEAMGKLKQYAGLNPVWFMNSYTFATSVWSLLHAQGGTDMPQTEAGANGMFMGLPVVYTQVLPGSAATTGDQVVVLGDLNLGAYSGQRRQITLKILNELFAVNDQIGITGTMRADSVIHSVGDATDAGCIVNIVLGV